MDPQLGQIISYIEEQRRSGAGDEAIRRVLVEHGWQPALVDQAFN